MKKWCRVAVVILVGACGAAQASDRNELLFAWPPVLGAPYPNFEFQMQNGATRSIGALKGKLVLVEMIGMNCPACQAWAGAKTKGAFEGVAPQENVSPIEQAFPQYTGGISLDDPRIVYIQILLFNMAMKAPTPQDVRRWSEHFHKGMKHPPIVIAGAPEFLLPRYYQQTYNLVPGFQVIDKKGILRYDATGDNPRQNLWRDVLPKIPELLNE